MVIAGHDEGRQLQRNRPPSLPTVIRLEANAPEPGVDEREF
jgi:hypothetical protein